MKKFLGMSLMLSLWASEARGHFLFVRITPPAEGGRAAEVYFSELAEAGDPTFIDKIAHTKLWRQTKPGEFVPLIITKGTDRLRASLSGSASAMVVGTCDYGVLTRKVSFLLRYFPKAMAGDPKELNAMRPHESLALEMLAIVDGEGLRFSALKEGKPVADAEFHIVPRDLKSFTVKAGPDGSITWKPPSPGEYSVYIKDVIAKPGTWKGKKYDEIRDFATLAFCWPLQPPGPDSAAVAMFQEALAARARWQDFPGFSAKIAGQVDGRTFSGSVTIAADGEATPRIKDETCREWVQEQLDSIVLHRGARGNSRATGKDQPFLYFGDQEVDHPLGRLLIFQGGRFASSYRVKDKQIMVVNRNMGKENMTITVLDNDRNALGQFMPRSYTVQYWDAAGGQLKRAETVYDRWARVGSLDLPASHTVTLASSAGLSVRHFSLSGHQLRKTKRPE